MIPREILKKIRQIELRTNRLATEFAAGARLGGKNQLVFWPALTCVLSPRRGFQPITLSVSPAVCEVNPVAGFPKDVGSVSRSPWGEGRDEGGRGTNYWNEKAHNSFPEAQCCQTVTWVTAADGNYGNAGSAIARSENRDQHADDAALFADAANRLAVGWDRVAQWTERVADGRERRAEWQNEPAEGANRVADLPPTFAKAENLAWTGGTLSRIGEAGARRAGARPRTVVADLRNPVSKERTLRFGLRQVRSGLRQVRSQLRMTGKGTRTVGKAARTLRTRLRNAIAGARTQISCSRSACQPALTTRMNSLIP